MRPFALLKQALQIARCHESNYGQHRVLGYFSVHLVAFVFSA